MWLAKMSFIYLPALVINPGEEQASRNKTLGEK